MKALELKWSRMLVGTGLGTPVRHLPVQNAMKTYEVEPEPEVLREIEEGNVHVDRLAAEAEGYLEDPDVDDTALARMFIEQGHSEALSYWLVRLANVRHAPLPKGGVAEGIN